MELKESNKQGKPSYTCCLCHRRFIGHGNNPDPLATEGRCCDECNRKVIEARILKAMEDWY
ncbi:MAG: hypothetical protein K6F32_07465 [Bacilli bacterium]|nr:hypothetical protein [Bacilli bacterium]